MESTLRQCRTLKFVNDWDVRITRRSISLMTPFLLESKKSPWPRKLRELIPFPLVRYVPAEEGSANVAWEDSDLIDIPLEDHNSRCYICLDDYPRPQRKDSHCPADTVIQDRLMQFRCGHVLHEYCANIWMKEHSNCFLCKSELPYPPEAVQMGDGWSVLFNLARDQSGIARRSANLDIKLLHAVQCGNMYNASFSADGEYCALMGTGVVYVLQTRTGSIVRTLECNEVWSSCINYDGRTVACGHKDGTIKIWTIGAADEHAEITNVLRGHKGGVVGLHFSENGGSLASISSDRTLRAWDITSGDTVHNIKMQNNPHYGQTSSARHNSYVVIGMVGGMIEVFDVDAGSAMNSWTGHGDEINSVSFTPDGTGLASASEDETVKFWSTSTIQFSTQHSDVDHMLVPETASDLDCTRRFMGHRGRSWELSVSHDGRWLACCHLSEEVSIWDMQTGVLQCVITVGGHGTQVYGLAFSPKDDVLIVCCATDPVQVWRLCALDDTQLASAGQHAGSVLSTSATILASATVESTLPESLEGAITMNDTMIQRAALAVFTSVGTPGSHENHSSPSTSPPRSVNIAERHSIAHTDAAENKDRPLEPVAQAGILAVEPSPSRTSRFITNLREFVSAVFSSCRRIP